MQTIFETKEQAITQTPLLVFDCVLRDGSAEHWSTHQVTAGGVTYSARVLQHNVFEIQTASDQGVDGIPRISIVLANADSHFSEIERATGWKGARLTTGFLFYDLLNDQPATEMSVIFQGTCNPPDEIREGTFRLTASNRMSLQRLVLPQVRIQRRCPWDFPTTDAQRTEAIDGGADGKYSRYYRCGYSAGAAGGSGNLKGTAPFTACGYTRGDCTARGMFSHFGGIEFVPPAISVRTYGDKYWHTSAVTENTTRYNDFVPLVYGTAWYTPPVVFARNDGNLTRMEVLLGIGEMTGVITMLVNDVEIPAGVAGTNMTGTGWYNVMTLGIRAGQCNPDFTDGSGQPAGDPYGSMAYAAVVVPNRLNDGTALPTVKVLVQGLKMPVYGADGTALGEQFSSNPAWIVLDILRRTGWSTTEIDLTTFAAGAAYCEEQIPAVDLNGNAVTLPRFQCNVALKNRRSAGDLLRGIRNTARMQLSYGGSGALQLRVENTIAYEQGTKPAWSNSTATVNGGWPSYEFGDGSSGISGILRRANGEPSVRLFSRSVADTPNRFTVEFQDALNGYQQDGFSLADAEDIALCGQEVSTTLSAIGIANYNQASRLLKVSLDKSVRGNTYIEFESSVKAFGVRPSDLVAVTYLKEGFTRQLFRVLKIAPGVNHRTTTITAQIHDDSWYADSSGESQGSGAGLAGPAGIGLPRPLLGSVLDGNGDIQFGVVESATTTGDGRVETSVTVAFVSPAIAGGPGPGIPLLSLSAQVGTGGTLRSGQTFYYGIGGVDAGGNEGRMSFLVRASVAADGSSITLGGLSFAPGTATFNAYRGPTPAQLFRIASGQAPAAQFTDTGLDDELAPPPDANFDHANFYWRMELQPEAASTVHSANTVGNPMLQMATNRYRGATARITRGTGAGQEATIAANSASILTLAAAWVIEPDASSFFVVAESGWKFGALANSSPVQFSVPNLPGETVHISGRAANVNDVECPDALAIVTRWQIGGSGGGAGDTDVPTQPFFGLSVGARGGTVELSAVSFADLTNTQTISSGTLTLYYRDELGVAPGTLASGMAASDTSLTLNAAGQAAAGSYVQVDGEVMRVEQVQGGGTLYSVTRVDTTTADIHAAQAAVYSLLKQTIVVPFSRGFFGSPYSGSWKFPIALADARVASAELFVTNAIGNSAIGSVNLTHNDEHGLRTLSGGQYSIQVSGFLAVQQAAAPPLVVETPHAVKDVYAVLGRTADADVQLQLNVDGNPYCSVTVPAGATVSTAADGSGLSPLQAGSHVTLSVLTVGAVNPGGDLTVLIRL